MLQNKMNDSFLLAEDCLYQEPKTWTIFTALECVLSLARDSKLDDDFWENCKNPMSFLTEKLGLTKIQVVVLAILIEEDEPLGWRQISSFLNCNRISLMAHSDEIEGLVEKRWVFHRRNGFDGHKRFALCEGVVSALQQNKPFVPEKIDGLQIQEFVDMLERHIEKNSNNHNVDFCDDEEWMLQLCKANTHLPICQEVLRYEDDIHVQSLFLMVVFDYAQWAKSRDEGLTLSSIDRTFPDEWETNDMRQKLRSGSHPLFAAGLIEFKCNEGIADTERYLLTKKCKEELLAGYKPSRSKCPSSSGRNRSLKSYKVIQQKEMFYNPEDQKQIERLTNLLSEDNLRNVRQRLRQRGMRKGVACLFYGAPGTGKTETVYQIARQTGRDIMQVDIAGMRDKFVGESEKNIKAVFQRYREICEGKKKMPILFFNEADALINKRTENISHSVDRMDNAMQNIILQEIENLNGILIATTNLTGNLDDAFERRFLFKVEFHQPDIEVRAKLWKSIVEGLTDEDAHFLAASFDFSGGQIENIARKQTISFVSTGKEPTLEEIIEFCEAEKLNKKTANRIGFC